MGWRARPDLVRQDALATPNLRKCVTVGKAQREQNDAQDQEPENADYHDDPNRE